MKLSTLCCTSLSPHPLVAFFKITTTTNEHLQELQAVSYPVHSAKLASGGQVAEGVTVCTSLHNCRHLLMSNTQVLPELIACACSPCYSSAYEPQQ